MDHPGGASPEKAMKMFWGAGTLVLGRHSGRTLQPGKDKATGRIEPFPAPKSIPRELQMDFGQGPAVAGQGELPPEDKYGEYWEEILSCESGEALEQVALTLQGMEQDGL